MTTDLVDRSRPLNSTTIAPFRRETLSTGNLHQTLQIYRVWGGLAVRRQGRPSIGYHRGTRPPEVVPPVLQADFGVDSTSVHEAKTTIPDTIGECFRLDTLNVAKVVPHLRLPVRFHGESIAHRVPPGTLSNAATPADPVTKRSAPGGPILALPDPIWTGPRPRSGGRFRFMSRT